MSIIECQKYRSAKIVELGPLQRFLTKHHLNINVKDIQRSNTAYSILYVNKCANKRKENRFEK